MRAKLIAVAMLLSAHSANAGPQIAHQTAGAYTPDKVWAIAIGTFVANQLMPLPIPAGGIFERGALAFGDLTLEESERLAALYRVPAPIMPGKISGARE